MTDDERRREAVLQKFWGKLESKFKEMGKTFRHFDRNFDG